MTGLEGVRVGAVGDPFGVSKCHKFDQFGAVGQGLGWVSWSQFGQVIGWTVGLVAPVVAPVVRT